MANVPIETLRRFLRYEPDTGRLFWNPRQPSDFTGTPCRTALGCCNNWNSQFAGKEALANIGNHGYKRGNLLGKNVLAHRVIVAMIRDAWDFDYVDHRDGDKLNNREVNLRVATNGQNIANSPSRKGASSPYMGVGWHRNNRKWTVYITKDYRQIYLGSYWDEIEAARAYDRAAMKYHGEFARLNFP